LKIAAGSTVGKMPMTTNTVPKSTAVTLTGSLAGVRGSATLTLAPPILKSLTISPNVVYGGFLTTGTITIDPAVSSGSIAVSLTSASSSVTVPATINIPAGATSKTFSILASPVDAEINVKISASLANTVNSAIIVNPAALASVAVTPSSGDGGSFTPAFKITLTSPAGPSGSIVTVVSSNTAVASFPATTVTIPAGKSVATVTIKTFKVAKSTTVTLTGALGGKFSATLTVNP
jgi:hypothetical protein